MPEPFEANSSMLGFENADVLWVILFNCYFFDASAVAAAVVLSPVDLCLLAVDACLFFAFFIVELFMLPGSWRFWALGSVCRLSVWEVAIFSSLIASSIHLRSSETCLPTLYVLLFDA